jgi:hypothetical protein
MEVSDHLLDARDASRHIVKHIELISAIDADVWICRPH